jgi:hypothetical protein
MKPIFPLVLPAAAPAVNKAIDKLDSSMKFDKMESIVVGLLVDNNYS